MNPEIKKQLRQQIDSVDTQLIELLLQRIQLSNAIIESKPQGQIVDAEREADIHRRYFERLAEASTQAKVQRLVEAVIATSRLYPLK